MAQVAPASRLRAVAIIPARLASTRLPRKMLLAESGAPLVVHTARNVAASAAFARVVVATDSDEIRDACRAHGVEACMTRVDHKSGTDRIQEALAGLDAIFDVAVNVQGDEPELAREDFVALVALFHDAEVELATLAVPLRDEGEWNAPSIVKVLRDARGDALYFSRAPLPNAIHARRRDVAPHAVARRHLGVYAFRPAALAAFCALAEDDLEALENLEQLRWFAAGRRMRVLDARSRALGIDTREDYDAFLRRARES